jgi:hypothetical protein
MTAMDPMSSPLAMVTAGKGQQVTQERPVTTTSAPISSTLVSRVSAAKTHNGYQNHSSQCEYNMNTEDSMVGHILDILDKGQRIIEMKREKRMTTTQQLI